MIRQVLISSKTLEKLDKLASLLEQASRLARDISRRGEKPFEPTIPELKRPKRIPKDEEWFWSKEWQKGEREANKDLAAGRFVEFDDIDGAIQWLQG
ncbi:MAG: hypothetical protein MN733_10720 [Nitrososphaera sp.]|nr:hypothetical protein [Nitrososphaera sp.]